MTDFQGKTPKQVEDTLKMLFYSGLIIFICASLMAICAILQS